MGAWGAEPWDNDSAADWFADLWRDVPIVDRVGEALRGGDGERMFAALWLCSELCRTYVWPVDHLDATLDAAIAAADQLLAGDDDEGFLEMWDDPDVTGQVESFRAGFVARRDRTDAAG